MWEILSTKEQSTRLCSSFFERLAASCNEAQGSDPGRCDPEKKRAAQIAKDKLRYARHLQRRIDWKTLQWEHCCRHDRELLREFREDVLRVKANHCVLEQGRGRLRGSASDDYEDIGPNKQFSCVSRLLDGPYKPPCIDRFRP